MDEILLVLVVLITNLLLISSSPIDISERLFCNSCDFFPTFLEMKLPSIELQHNPKVFNSLNDIDVAKKVQKNEDSHDNIASLSQILYKHGLQGWIGIALLHKHFELENNEKMVFFVGDNEDVLVGFPVIDNQEFSNKNNKSCHITPYMFKADNIKQGWLPLQYFCDSESIIPARKNMIFHNYDEALGEIASYLIKNNLTDTLGIFIRGFAEPNMKADEFLIEYTDVMKRVQFFQVGHINKNNEDIINTHYVFDDSINVTCESIPRREHICFLCVTEKNDHVMKKHPRR